MVIDEALPIFTAPGASEPSAVAASRAVVELILREGAAKFSVKQLAAHAGLAERTFYRYFPRKEDAVRPYLEAALANVVARLAEAPAEVSLRDALVESQGPILEFARRIEVRRLLDVLNGTERLRAVWLGVLTDAERMFAEVVAARLELAPDSTHARFAGAAIVAAGRLALDSEAEASRGGPREVLAACLDLLGPGLLEEAS